MIGLLAATALALGSAAPLDDFSDLSAWQAGGSDQVRTALRREGAGLCLDYDFAGVSGYAVLRRGLPIDYPANYEFGLKVWGNGGRNDLQFKLSDASGDNVWWVNRKDFQPGSTPIDWRIKKRHIGFAWGPTLDRTLRRSASLELVVAAGQDGGRGSLCFSALTFTAKPVPPAVLPAPRVKGSRAPLDGWTAGPGRRQLDIDLGTLREFNGLLLQWAAGRMPRSYRLSASVDGKTWHPVRTVKGTALDALYLPESEARWLRLQLDAGPRGVALQTFELPDAAQWPDRNAMLMRLAQALPRGDLPRAFLRQQNYWTLVGVDGGGQRSALISEDGALELGRGGPSLEPFIRLDGGPTLRWADVSLRQSLRDGYLPMPAVHWEHERVGLDVEAAAQGSAAAPDLLLRYRLRNKGSTPLRLVFGLALRPWQVNPPQQFLSTPGGISPLRQLAWDGRQLSANGWPLVQPLAPPSAVRAAPFEAGLALADVQQPLSRLDDPQGLASATLDYTLELPPGGEQVLAFVAPLGNAAVAVPADMDAAFDAVARHWRGRLNRVELGLPPQAQRIADSLRTALAQILMSRDGPALRPGTRSYARTWVRDGAMMVAGLVRLGEIDAAREFVDWYGPQIFASGKVPCCVDARGADPVAENDSHGQYLYAVAEVWRHARGPEREAWLRSHWPRVRQVVAYMEGLRQSERHAANLTPERRAFYGLMPPSISHEGYSDKPAYAYWDDFWALRGYKDAVQIAQALGAAEEARRWSGWRDQFQADFMASIAAASSRHLIDHIAGAADRGDFDATSTTMALNPVQARAALPGGLLEATFERYWRDAQARAEGSKPWVDYTPYELRNVGALVRLGRVDRAQALLDFFFKDQRPPGWNQWAEVVLPDPRQAKFLGDMPHAWVSSDFIRSALDLFAYEADGEDQLVIGAGLPRAWLEGAGVSVARLSTPHGLLGYTLRRDGAGWRLRVEAGVSVPLRLRWSGDDALPVARLKGQVLPWAGRELALPAGALEVELGPAMTNKHDNRETVTWPH